MRQSILFANPKTVLGYGSVAGKKEKEGPLGAYFDFTSDDTHFGEKSWEKAESKMQQLALQTALSHAGLAKDALEMIFCGDLLNQCIGSSFSLRGTGIPTVGLYGACSTMALGLLMAGMAEGKTAAALTSSHFASSERQYRFPLGYGGQRTPTAQWTVTGAGCVILGEKPGKLRIRGGTVGAITDFGICDASNMGAAMAPAAVETMQAHFRETGKMPEDYDLIVTGDLGAVGRQIVQEQMEKDGIALGSRYLDCGELIFDRKRQDVHAGGSGCGCSAAVLCGYLLPQMEKKVIKNLLFCGTGALLSPVSTNQGESIPSVCHAVWISREED